MTPQKITVKIPRKQSELIPFNLELWNTGEYEVIHKSQGIGKVVCTDNGGDYPIVVVYGEGRVSTYTFNGKFKAHQIEPSLYLRKKSSEELPKDVFVNLYEDKTALVEYTFGSAEMVSRHNRRALLHITYEWEDAV